MSAINFPDIDIDRVLERLMEADRTGLTALDGCGLEEVAEVVLRLASDTRLAAQGTNRSTVEGIARTHFVRHLAEILSRFERFGSNLQDRHRASYRLSVRQKIRDAERYGVNEVELAPLFAQARQLRLVS